MFFGCPNALFISTESIFCTENVLLYDCDCASFGSIRKHLWYRGHLTIIMNTGCVLTPEVFYGASTSKSS